MGFRSVGGRLIVGGIVACTVLVFVVSEYGAAAPRQSMFPPLQLSARVINFDDTLTVSGTDCQGDRTRGGVEVSARLGDKYYDFFEGSGLAEDGSWTMWKQFSGYPAGKYEVIARCVTPESPHPAYPPAYFTLVDPNAPTTTKPAPPTTEPPPPPTEPETTTTSTTTTTLATTTTTTAAAASEVAAAPTGGTSGGTSITGLAAMAGASAAAAIGLGLFVRHRRAKSSEPPIDIVDPQD
ncbi:MAG: hypothetical protein QOI95_1446 [Acidimicrobiaceae bacterium]|jgi:hypothetical protein